MPRKFLCLMLLFVYVAIGTACSSAPAETPGHEVVFDDGYKTTEGGEVMLSDTDFQSVSPQVKNENGSRSEGIRTLPDSSSVDTLVDGFGNRTETRTFGGHPRLRMVIVRTAVDGTVTVTAYGYGEDTKTVSELGDKALSASADEIANAAKLYTTRTFTETPKNFMKRKEPDLKPLPSSEFPVRQPEPSVNEPDPEQPAQEDSET